MGSYEKTGVKLEEVRKKSGNVWVVYNEKKQIVVITCDRNVAKSFMKPAKERK
tara:strand:- start:141 stop:299 length:159 start_codon:yes stop_codon:yes gene_type:complete